MNALATDVRNGNALAPDEKLVWRGKPSFRRIARDALHLRAAVGYFALLFALDAYQAWAKDIPAAQAVHDSVPLAAITGLALAILTAIAWMIVRTTRYTVTDRRVILQYGIAMPATLAIPLSQISGTAVAAAADGTADVVLALKPGNRMAYLKLWPHARPWRLSKPEPMLRGVPGGEVMAASLTEALQSAEQGRALRSRPAVEPMRIPELLSA